MIYKRGKTYWYKFMWQGKLIRESTKQGNDKVARQIEAAHRTSLAKGEVGIRDKKPVPTLAAFLTDRVLPWAQSTFAASRVKTWKWYRNECRVLTAYKPLAETLIDSIISELVSEFAAHRLKEGKQIATINSSLRVLRRVLNLAVEWGVLPVAPKLKVLPGERRRERVVSVMRKKQDILLLHLSHSPRLQPSWPTLVCDPRNVSSYVGSMSLGSTDATVLLLVTHGKTASARRVLPMTPRVRAVLESRWIAAGKPEDGWVWPAGTRSGHVEPNSIYGQHLNAQRVSGVRPFVLYSLRHTFLTRLGESGCDSWTLARIAGHSSVAISARYLHPSEDAVLAAISRLGGHSSGHSEEKQISVGADKLLTTNVQ